MPIGVLSSYRNFGKRKKNVKIPLSAIWLVQRDFSVYDM